MKLRRTAMQFLAVCVFAIGVVACGGGGGGDNAESAEDATLTTNPIATGQEFFGQNGNIWKPRADEEASGGGNLVILLNSAYTTRFDTCEVRKNDGTVAQLLCNDFSPWTMIPFSCFSNGDRQTWRANFTCDEAAEVRVVCRDAMQEVTFLAPDGRVGEICSRFG